MIKGCCTLQGFVAKKLIILLIVITTVLVVGCNTKDNLSSSEINLEKVTDLLVLDTFEKAKYDEFKSSYNEDVLIGVEPISILKMFMYAKNNEDYETQYELFTKNPDYVLESKDDFINFSADSIPFEKEIFEDVYDINLETYVSDTEYAYISWKSKNGYKDDVAGDFTYGFQLQKDVDVWKVSYNPMN